MTQSSHWEQRRSRFGLPDHGAEPLDPEFHQALSNALIELEARQDELHSVRSEITSEIGKIDERLAHVDALLTT